MNASLDSTLIISLSLLFIYCELQNEKKLSSPTTISTLFWFLSRWSRTYLLRDPATVKIRDLISSFGPPGVGGHGVEILNTLLQLTLRALCCMGGEEDVIDEVKAKRGRKKTFSNNNKKN